MDPNQQPLPQSGEPTEAAQAAAQPSTETQPSTPEVKPGPEPLPEKDPEKGAAPAAAQPPAETAASGEPRRPGGPQQGQGPGGPGRDRRGGPGGGGPGGQGSRDQGRQGGQGQQGQQGQGPRGQGGRPGGGDRRGGPFQGRDSRPPQQGQKPQNQAWAKPDFLAKAVEGGIDRSFIEGAQEFARALGGAFTPGEFRSVYGELMRQEMTSLDPARLLLLKPRLAWLAARAGRSEVREMRTVLERGIDRICAEGIADGERQARLDRFSRGLEAILAYHKMYERKQGERA